MNLQVATLMSMLVVAGGSVEGMPPSPFQMSAGAARRERVQAIRDRTGWAYVKCRELVDTKRDAEIEMLVREHEETARAAEKTG